MKEAAQLRLRMLLATLDIPQGHLSRKAHVDQGHLSRFLTGKVTNPGPALKQRIAAALREFITPERIF